MPENGSRPTRQGAPFFGETLFEETGSLGVVRASFEDFGRSSFEELIAGYRSMKVLAYSNSVSIINKAAASVEKLEIVFGRENTVGKMAQYVYFQELLLEELIEEIVGEDPTPLEVLLTERLVAC